MKGWHWLFHIFLLVLVGFFGYHYVVRSELRECVSAPIADVVGGNRGGELNQEKVEEFLQKIGVELVEVASKGGQLASDLWAVTSASESSWQEQLVDKGKYLYCRAVVDKVEREK